MQSYGDPNKARRPCPLVVGGWRWVQGDVEAATRVPPAGAACRYYLLNKKRQRTTAGGRLRKNRSWLLRPRTVVLAFRKHMNLYTYDPGVLVSIRPS